MFRLRKDLVSLRLRHGCSLNRTFELAASRINITTAWTPHKSWNSRLDQNFLESCNPLFIRSRNANSRSRIQRNQIDLGSQPTQQLNYFLRTLDRVVHLAQNHVFKCDALATAE